MPTRQNFESSEELVARILLKVDVEEVAVKGICNVPSIDYVAKNETQILPGHSFARLDLPLGNLATSVEITQVEWIELIPSCHATSSEK